ncbi:hypothetical protein NYR75_02755 [Actinobacillus equuli subsp. haemolyticus]|uniref:Uncharacterized protein n=1 Tax=Actinobacillus equuli subsp. equuli TaxID=202947 RepID=A0A9X4JC53_ACTEU|nr:hypothetical protein [Actinobacillus equuli]MDE8034616.1 hypothetical protein [Actinobacillus equuli subsp. equuli]MDG4948748.1 hypothetical protein [Actinobacillus equuli subsp. haemolyticus]WGE63761.1 hypothetical protein NYR75_02755 [Actinobacillus equuli subsp. haemolyticus]
MQSLIRSIILFADEKEFFNDTLFGPEVIKLNLISEAGSICLGVKNKDRNLIKKGIGGCIIYSTVLLVRSGIFYGHSIGFGSESSMRGFKFSADDFSDALNDVISKKLPPREKFRKFLGVLYSLAINFGLSFNESFEYRCELFDNKCGVAS